MERMPLVECLEVLRAARRDQVVITTMGTAREWMKLGSHPLDFIYAPSAMGEAPSLGLGLALARPNRQVIVCNGDGCMLMNLGCLVTITAAAPRNYVLVVFENSVYEVTGGQATAAAAAVRPAGARVDFAALARGAGFQQVHQFRSLESWQEGVHEVLRAVGPTFVVVHVEPVPGGAVPVSPGPAPDRARALARALEAAS
jgi:thiamine pyrophosphate-dependent acetolactate synthase large subunit-like protein